MERSARINNRYPRRFIRAGLILLALGLLFGLTGALQYLVPGIFKSHLSFEKTRPLHVSSAVFWILLSATGAVLAYVQEYCGKGLYSPVLARIQFYLFAITVPFILLSYCAGIFGGREYWEFHPVLAIPIALGWILFAYNLFRTIGTIRRQPVYVWMWATGAVFFLFTFAESYLWLIPYFRGNIVNDMTVQWKSYGSMVGSWNMLIYGCSLFLMEKISGNKSAARSNTAFALYFTGLFNLMFNWGHHIYTLPTHGYIKHASYLVSMTELFILGRMIRNWSSTLTTARQYLHLGPYRFLIAAEIWVFLTLALAICMSVPAINVYTHGTHITVAHTMGATIGINSFLLLAIAHDLLKNDEAHRQKKQGWYLVAANIALLAFWISLILAGIWKARWQMSSKAIPFSTMMAELKPFFIGFFIAGTLLALIFGLIIFSLLKKKVHDGDDEPGSLQVE